MSIHFKIRENYLDQKYVVKPTDLLYVYPSFSKNSQAKIGLDSKFLKFLWGGIRLEKSPHLGRWTTMCLDRERGGLGVKDVVFTLHDTTMFRRIQAYTLINGIPISWLGDHVSLKESHCFVSL